ncbi:MAG TPA: nicotinate-nicotinamide nucleotide adenylyltransferase [Kofleriaceae bacterium]|jgi:nicotinate-nucleotide adenylyltransferase|nr:nicotinate-nicotinamide nucleotide adenylyltransferase [Kofleriaceae bacterium]
MARVALFGGSFNPPHVAHQMVGLYVLETQAVDELWFVPTFAHPFGKSLVSYEHRVAMCELAAAALGPRARVSQAEAELAARPGFVTSHTVDLVDLVIDQGHAPRLVIGADILREAARWHRWDDVVAGAPLIVVGRGGHAPPPGGAGAARVTMPEISATHVRDLLARGDSGAAGLVPRDVLRYIAEHHLYQP